MSEPFVIPQAVFWTYVFAFVAVGYGMLRVLEFAIVRYYRMSHPLAFFVNGDSGQGYFKRLKAGTSEVPIGKERTVKLEGAARIGTPWGSVWIIDLMKGWNLYPAPDAETVGSDKMLAWLGIWNPASNGFLAKKNLIRHTFEAMKDAPSWIPVVAFIVVAGVLACVGMLSWVVSNWGPQAAAAVTGAP